MIGLFQIDGKYPNLALMKLSAWHKKQGDEVTTLPMEFDKCDKVYASKTFNFKCSKDGYDNGFTIGGTGFEWKNGKYVHSLPDLPLEVEHSYPDYKGFNCDFAMGFLTRGCIRHCKFCIVPCKEGKIRHHADLNEWWHGQKYIRLLDPNVTAYPDCVELINELASTKSYMDFNQGLDARLMTEEIAVALSKCKKWKWLHLAWDHVQEEESVLRGLSILHKYCHTLMVYVLIGYDSTPEEDYYRVMKLREMEDIDPFVMPYDKSDPYQQRFARWVNMKATFNAVDWKDYK